MQWKPTNIMFVGFFEVILMVLCIAEQYNKRKVVMIIFAG